MPAPRRKTARNKQAAPKTVRARVTPASPGFALYAKTGAVLLVLVLAVLWVGKMQNVAYSKRLHRDLSENPRLSDWYLEQVELVKTNAGPSAIWHGRIKGLTIGNAPVAGGTGPLRAVRLGKATLLAGMENRGDSEDDVYINVTDYPLTYGVPVAGERWVFSVSHTRDGRNKVFSALPRRQ